jgi:hypothetical protein
MRDKALPLTGVHLADGPFPVWACAAIVLSMSGLCYWLLACLIGALGL